MRKSAQQLLTEWQQSQAYKMEWLDVTRLRSFNHLMALIEAIATEKAHSWGRHDADPILARNLAEQKGAIGVIRFLETASDPEVKVETQVEEPFGHIDEDYFTKRHQPDNQTN